MKVYLLRRLTGKPLFYGEAEAGESEAQASRGWLGWVGQKWGQWQKAVTAAEGRAGGLLRKLESWLKTFEGADEAMLRALGWVPEVALVHPAAMKGSSVRRLWSHYLKRERGRHQLWLMFNVVVIPPTVMMALLPGPNLIGYWCVYRAACHALALAGIRRALRARGTTELEADAELNEPLPEDAGDPAVERLAERCGWSGFRGFLERTPRRARVAAPGEIEGDGTGGTGPPSSRVGT